MKNKIIDTPEEVNNTKKKKSYQRRFSRITIWLIRIVIIYKDEIISYIRDLLN